MLDRALERRGFERVRSELVYPWQRVAGGGVPASPAPADSGPTGDLHIDAPRLRELTEAYAKFDSVLSRDPVWTDTHVRTTDLTRFRGDNPYVWQLRGRNLNALGYALSYYAIRRVDRGGLLDRLDEDGLFGVNTFVVDGRTVSRDLLDSVLELDFLDRRVGLATGIHDDGPRSRSNRCTILDIGAGYGRLAYRTVTAFPDTVRYLCTDAIPTSTFLAEFYLKFRGTTPRARVVPLHELEAAITPGSVDLAVNVHSFSECPLPAIDGWLDLLARKDVPRLLLVPNAVAEDGTTPLTNAGEAFGSLLRRHGYSLVAHEPKFVDPVVQAFGVSPATYLLYRRR